MRFRHSDSDELEDLFDDVDHPKRGRRFEKLLSSFLASQRFEVRLNPRSAAPRQTDILATDGSGDYLIEAKWLKRRIDIQDVDSLRSRLARTPADVVGCLFSMSDYGEAALKGVRDDRTREILLFNAAEIYGSFTGRWELRDLLRRKRRALREDAEVVFQSIDGPPVTDHIALPVSPERLALDNQSLTIHSLVTGFEDFLFCRQIPDLPWLRVHRFRLALNRRCRHTRSASIPDEQTAFLSQVFRKRSLCNSPDS